MAKELDIVIVDEVLADMADDPVLAAVIRDICAAFRQADHAVKSGQHKTFDDAMEAITGSRPEVVLIDDEDAS